MPDDQWEVVVKLAVHYLCRRGCNHFAQIGGNIALIYVHQSAGFLDHTQRADNGDGLLFPADGKVDDRPLRLRAPVFVGGHIQRAKAIGFNANVSHAKFLAYVALLMGQVGAKIKQVTVGNLGKISPSVKGVNRGRRQVEPDFCFALMGKTKGVKRFMV